MPFSGSMFRDVWDSIANRGLDLISKRFAASSSLTAISKELLSEKGEASGAALARRIAELYQKSTPAAQETFFLSLLHPDFLPDPVEVLAAANAYRARPDSETVGRLAAVVDPPRQELFRRINLAPGGTRLIVQMREDLMKLLKAHPELKAIDADFHHLLSSWFNRGFLRLERIDWRTPALVLEKLMEHEAVHEIHGWDDLRRRLADDRRCFAFFHPSLPDEPLIFVEVALTRGLPPSIQFLLERSAPPMQANHADTAIFYSINNCLTGLRGISFGNFLIKQVVAELEAEKLPVRSFVTLSPVPGFRKWLEKMPDAARAALLGPSSPAPSRADANANKNANGNAKANASSGASAQAGSNAAAPPTAVAAGLALLKAAEASDSKANHDALEAARPQLLRLCAHYLLNERNQDRALDPVAAFHLGNGAAIEQLNWLGDSSAKGIAQSFGIMVNYAYRPWQIERNHEAYVKRGKVAASDRVRELMQQPIGKAN